MPLGSLRHTFSDTVADIDGLSVRTRLAGGGGCGRGGAAGPGRRGVADAVAAPSAAPVQTAAAAAAVDERLPLRGFDVGDQPGSSSRTWSQRHKSVAGPPRTTPAAGATDPAAAVETPQGSIPSGLAALQSTVVESPPPRTSPRPLCVIDCCCCCTGSILVSWLKVRDISLGIYNDFMYY